MYDIYNFCAENPDYEYIIDDVYTNESMMDYIKDLVADCNFCSVRDFLDFADEIPDSEWYLLQDGIIYSLTFDELKDDLLRDLRNDEFFTDEEFTNSDDSQNNTDIWVDSKNNTDTDDDIVANDISVLYGE